MDRFADVIHESRAMTTGARTSRLPASLALWLPLMSLGVLVLSRSIADPDLWGHVRFGQDILRAGSIPWTDPYSYRTAGATWINHEWLAEVVFAATYDHLGPSGLIAVKVTAGLAVLGMGCVHLSRRGWKPVPASLLLAIGLAPLSMGLGTIRPQLFTYLGFFGILMIVERASRGSVAWLWPAPPILALWINLHGGVLAGIGILGIWSLTTMAGLALDGSIPRRKRIARSVAIAVPLALAIMALSANPYGVRLPLFLLRTATVPRPEISEWAPLAIASLAGVTYLLFVGLGLGVVISARDRLDAGTVAVLAVSAVLPLIAQRHLPLFVLAVVVLAAKPLAERWDRRPRVDDRPRSRRAGMVARVVAVVLSLGFVTAAIPRFACIRIEPRYWPFPAQAIALIRASGVEGGLALPFDWGEYAIWHLAPRVRVSVDGRRETVYSEETYRESLDFTTGRGRWDALLDDPGTDLALVGVGSPPANLLSLRRDWFRVYEDGVAILFVRAGSPLGRPLGMTPPPRRPVDGAGLCFP